MAILSWAKLITDCYLSSYCGALTNGNNRAQVWKISIKHWVWITRLFWRRRRLFRGYPTWCSVWFPWSWVSSLYFCPRPRTGHHYQCPLLMCIAFREGSSTLPTGKRRTKRHRCIGSLLKPSLKLCVDMGLALFINKATDYEHSLWQTRQYTRGVFYC